MATSQPEVRRWRLGFAGTPDFARTVLEALVASPHEVSVVFTQPDRRAGRGRRKTPSPTRLAAEAAGIPVHTPGSLDDEIAALGALDWLVVAAYGLLLGAGALAAPRHGCLNVHASLLPRWRGAAPVERAIMAGDAATGVSIMAMDAGLDTGPVYLRRQLDIGAASGAQVTASLAELGAGALLDTLARLPELRPVPQDDALATVAPRLNAADAVIDWRRDAADVARQVQALAGRMPAYATSGAVRVRILEAAAHPGAGGAPGTLQHRGGAWRVACGDGLLELVTVQLNRGRGTRLDVASAARGFPDVLGPGSRFDVPSR